MAQCVKERRSDRPGPIDFCPLLMLDCIFDLLEEEELVRGAKAKPIAGYENSLLTILSS